MRVVMRVVGGVVVWVVVRVVVRCGGAVWCGGVGGGEVNYYQFMWRYFFYSITINFGTLGVIKMIKTYVVNCAVANWTCTSF